MSKIDDRIGRFAVRENCPRCGSRLLVNNYGQRWCSLVPSRHRRGCSYGMDDKPDSIEASRDKHLPELAGSEEE